MLNIVLSGRVPTLRRRHKPAMDTVIWYALGISPPDRFDDPFRENYILYLSVYRPPGWTRKC